MSDYSIIFGNGGEFKARHVDGHVYDYEPSQDSLAGSHEGYGLVHRVDWPEHLAYWNAGRLPDHQYTTPHETIDICDVRCTLADGTIWEPEEDWRFGAKIGYVHEHPELFDPESYAAVASAAAHPPVDAGVFSVDGAITVTFESRALYDEIMNGTTPSLEETFRALLMRAVLDWPPFDSDDEVNAGDLVDWFGNWRREVKEALGMLSPSEAQAEQDWHDAAKGIVAVAEIKEPIWPLDAPQVNLPTLADIWANPETALVPADAPGRYAVASAMAAKVDGDTFGAALTYAPRLGREYEVLFAATACQRDHSLVHRDDFIAWCVANADVIMEEGEFERLMAKANAMEDDALLASVLDDAGGYQPDEEEAFDIGPADGDDTFQAPGIYP